MKKVRLKKPLVYTLYGLGFVLLCGTLFLVDGLTFNSGLMALMMTM